MFIVLILNIYIMKSNELLSKVESRRKLFRMTLMAMIAFFYAIPAITQSTVVDIIADSPDHSTLEAAVVAAELADDLSSEGPFTVFAPTDDAFAALPEGTVESLLEDPTGKLAQILLYHVVGAKALSTDLSNGQMIATLEGTDVSVSIDGGKVFINDAQVTVADIKADNGVVHVIDLILIPTTPVGEKKDTESGFYSGL